MRLRALLLVVALAATMAPADATHGSGGCGSPTDPKTGLPRWQSTRTAWCTFDIRGFPVSVTGEARDPTSNNRTVTVRVWVTLAEEHELSSITGHEPVTFLECQDTGQGFASCEDDLSIDQVVDVQRGWVGRWRCNVEAIPSGSWTPQLTYFCSVGTGIG